jgi:hypothetical protein
MARARRANLRFAFAAHTNTSQAYRGIACAASSVSSHVEEHLPARQISVIEVAELIIIRISVSFCERISEVASGCTAIGLCLDIALRRAQLKFGGHNVLYLPRRSTASIT